MSAKRTNTTTCRWGCGKTITTRCKIPADGLGCGQGECLDKHNAAVAAADAAAREARRNRPRPQKTVVMGEWGMAVMLGRIGSKKD